MKQEFRADRDIVMHAVDRTPKALIYASKELQESGIAHKLASHGLDPKGLAMLCRLVPISRGPNGVCEKSASQLRPRPRRNGRVSSSLAEQFHRHAQASCQC
eukprot:6127536-Amphidinium_carterae.1